MIFYFHKIEVRKKDVLSRLPLHYNSIQNTKTRYKMIKVFFYWNRRNFLKFLALRISFFKILPVTIHCAQVYQFDQFIWQ